MNKTTELDIYVRAYTKTKIATPSGKVSDAPANIKRPSFISPSRIIVFDTETTNDERQALKFGYFEIIQNCQIEFCGLFYNENLVSAKELAILTDYSNSHQLPLMTRKLFNDAAFYPEVFFKQTCCVGFNLPFDISRIAIDSGCARDKTMLGGFSFKLSTNMEYPRVLVKHISNTMSFIKFSRSIIKYTNGFKGNLVDLRTLGWAIRNKKFTLESACKEFNTEIQKKQARQHGKITPEYVDYCVNDVKSTYSLFTAMLKDYEKYQIDLELTKAFSPASIGKALLRKMGISEMSQKISSIPDTLLGYVMSAYYGGRSEVRIRKVPTPVVYMDFLSMYPTVCILMDLWKFIIADHIEYADCTSEVCNLVDGITLERLTEKAFWKNLTIIVEVEPHGDILPIRAKYDGQIQGIGINHLEGNGKRLWFTIHDVIVSKLLTGRTPKIIKAIRFVPLVLQDNLNPIQFLGRQIDPAKDDFFKALIEYRKELQEKTRTLQVGLEQSELMSKQYVTKIIANATSYGIFIEINEAEQDSPIEVFGLDNFSTLKTKVEKTGSMFNPILAVLITGASRLMLGMAEAFVSLNGGYIAFCDTDSIAVNPQIANELRPFFSPLNPYEFAGDILKIEDENYKLTADSEPDYSINPIENPLLFFGVSAKRYALYRKVGSKIQTIKNTEHGLGGFMNPFGKNVSDWTSKFWHNALVDYYHQNEGSGRDVLYSDLPVISKQVISTKTVMEKFYKMNIGKDYDHKIKPFNFFLVGVGKNKEISPMLPFSRHIGDKHHAIIDYKTGRKLSSRNFLKLCKTFDEVYSGYFNHPEDKFENGDKCGLLQRKAVTVRNIIHIGKETSGLELDYVLGLNNLHGDICEEYRNFHETSRNKETFRLRKRSKLRKFVDVQFDEIIVWIVSLNNVNLSKYGISKKMLYRTKRSIKLGHVQKLSKNTKLKFINCHQKLVKSWTLSNAKRVGQGNSDNNIGQKGVIMCQ